MTQPTLIAIDWGTSNLRAALLNVDGHPIESRSTPGGVMAVKDGRFADALSHLCGDWMHAYPCALIASGMVGSRQGWQEAPYLDCPASIDKAANNLTPIELNLPGHVSRRLYIAPGLRFQEPSGVYDVMRGEETQIWGANIAPKSCCILPGTHSKWAWTGQKGEILRFQTWMTGELFGLHTQHGILGRLMQTGAKSIASFEAGVRLGLSQLAKANHVVFAARTAGLMEQVPTQQLADYLSGILIGLEVAGGMQELPHAGTQTITLIGDDGLCERYGLALKIAGLHWVRSEADATTRGQWLIAEHAGLLAKNGV